MNRRYLIASLFLLVGCSSKVGTLHVTVVRSPDPEQDPFGDASAIRVRIDAPGVLVGPETFSINERSGTLSEVPVGSDREVTIEGLGPEENVVSRGRTGPLEIESGENSLYLYVGLMDTFSYINAKQLSTARAFHTATLLTNGSVLVSGGITGEPWRPEADLPLPSPTNSTEIINGNALSTIPSGSMEIPRVGHTATLLDSGNVLIAGGALPSSSSADAGLSSPDGGPVGPTESQVAEVEVFKNERFFGDSGNLIKPRAWHCAALTVEGVVLAGGMASGGQAIREAEVYRKGTLEPHPGMLVQRRAFTLTTLEDGTLMAAGGLDSTGKPLASTELYSPGSALWKTGPDLRVARAHHTATRLEDGTLLIIGGLTAGGNTTDSLELYDPSQNTIRELKHDQQQTARWAHTATLLTDGRILIVGGFALNVNGSPSAGALEVQYFGDNRIQVKPLATLNEARAGHAATLLQSGMLLITGGISSSGPSRTAEVFVY